MRGPPRTNSAGCVPTADQHTPVANQNEDAVTCIRATYPGRMDLPKPPTGMVGRARAVRFAEGRRGLDPARSVGAVMSLPSDLAVFDGAVAATHPFAIASARSSSACLVVCSATSGGPPSNWYLCTSQTPANATAMKTVPGGCSSCGPGPPTRGRHCEVSADQFRQPGCHLTSGPGVDDRTSADIEEIELDGLRVGHDAAEGPAAGPLDGAECGTDIAASQRLRGRCRAARPRQRVSNLILGSVIATSLRMLKAPSRGSIGSG